MPSSSSCSTNGASLVPLVLKDLLYCATNVLPSLIVAAASFSALPVASAKDRTD